MNNKIFLEDFDIVSKEEKVEILKPETEVVIEDDNIEVLQPLTEKQIQNTVTALPEEVYEETKVDPEITAEVEKELQDVIYEGPAADLNYDEDAVPDELQFLSGAELQTLLKVFDKVKDDIKEENSDIKFLDHLDEEELEIIKKAAARNGVDIRFNKDMLNFFAEAMVMQFGTNVVTTYVQKRLDEKINKVASKMEDSGLVGEYIEESHKKAIDRVDKLIEEIKRDKEELSEDDKQKIYTLAQIKSNIEDVVTMNLIREVVEQNPSILNKKKLFKNYTHNIKEVNSSLKLVGLTNSRFENVIRAAQKVQTEPLAVMVIAKVFQQLNLKDISLSSFVFHFLFHCHGYAVANQDTITPHLETFASNFKQLCKDLINKVEAREQDLIANKATIKGNITRRRK